MEFNFNQYVIEKVEYDSVSWGHYTIQLNEKITIVILTGFFEGKDLYSEPAIRGKDFYSVVCITINTNTNYFSYNPAAVELYLKIKKYEAIGEFNKVPVEILYELMEHFGIVGHYCNDCGVKLNNQETLCWACENGI